MKFVSMFLALALAAFAADNPPVMSRLIVVDVPSETSAEFYDLQRDTAEIYKANKAPMPRWVWTSLTGTARCVILSPLASLDKWTESSWLNQQGTESSRRDRSVRLRNVGGHATYKVITQHAEPTWDSAPGAAPSPFAAVSVHEVKPGKTTEYLTLMKQLGEAVKKVGKAKSFYVSRTSYGASWGEFHVVTGYASLADIPTSSAALRAALGEAGYTAWSEKLNACINSTTRDLYRYRSEYSYLPPKPAK